MTDGLFEHGESRVREEVHLHVHFDSPITINVVVQQPPKPPKPKATHAVLKIQGAAMPGQITVDTTNETVLIEFIDDKGNTNAAAPAGAVVTFTSDNDAVVTVATDPANSLQGDIVVVAEGSANIGATLANADGTPVLEADGVTPFPVPAPVAVTVSAGAAVGDALVLGV